MNADIRTALADAELALEVGDVTNALEAFVEAGDYAVHYQLWRSALRSYRCALELDLTSRTTVAKLAAIAVRVGGHADWQRYAVCLEQTRWPAFGCRNAQVVIGDQGAFVECASVGRVILFAMTGDDRIEAHPDLRFAEMPLAMAIVILHRALWPRTEHEPVPRRLQIGFGPGAPVWLDQLGEWKAP